MPTKGLGALGVLSALESKIAYIPGGRDRGGRPFIIVDVPPELHPSTKPRLESLILYFLTIFSEETKRNGLLLIVDARRGAWRVARSCVRLSTSLLGCRATSVIVVRPDGFWDKRVDSCTRSHKEGEPTYVTLTKLHSFVDFSQLPYELFGNRMYDHTEWIQKRLKFEEYTRDASELLSKMSNLHQKLSSLDGIHMRQSDDDLESYWELGMELTSTAHRILHAGRSLTSSTSRETSKDMLDTIKRIHDLVDSIELKQVEIDNLWSEMERNLDSARVIDDLEKGVSRVTDWILGPADAMLNSCCQVGFDVVSSEELRRQHEKLELECRETYGRYAELLHKIDGLPRTRLPDDLKSQRDFMDFVCRSFASRLERRRNVLITSQRFFRLVSEYFDKTSEVFDKLVMGNRSDDFHRASLKLFRLEKNQSVLESLEQEIVKEGEKLSDILSMPVKDALGRDVCVDYEEDIVNVRDILDATNARKNIFNDSVELQKLTLKQIALIHTYEGDAEQAVKWLNDLFDVLLEKHMEVGCNVNEIQSQKEEHQSFQETAKGTYDYGCQLVNGARVLRLSCRLPLGTNAGLYARLRRAWRQLRTVGEEQLTRLRVCAVFHRSVEDHCSRLRELIDTVGSLRRATKAEDLASESRARAEIRDILGDREKLLLEVGRMVRLGRLLRTRLKEPVSHQGMSEAEDASAKTTNLTAVEAITAKLAEVTRLAEKLDAKLCEAGARTRPVPVSTSAMSLPSSLGSFTKTTTTATPTSTTTTSGSTTTTSSFIAIPISTSSTPVEAAEASSLSRSTSKANSTMSITKGASPTDDAALASAETRLEAILEDTSIFAPSIVTGTTNTTTETTQPVASIDDVALEESSPRADQPASSLESTLLDGEANDKENSEKSFDNATEETNVESYVTATECSITPIARSRSESFETYPEGEEVAPTPLLSISQPWSDAEKPVLISSTMNVASSIVKGTEESKTDDVKDAAKAEINGSYDITPLEKIVSVETSTEERSGRIVKEVTETTTLRVSHDTRLGVASYKVTSNTLEDHRLNVDVKELRDVERVTIVESEKQMNGSHAETGEPSSSRDKRSDKLENDTCTRTRPSEEEEFFSEMTKETTTQEESSETITKETKMSLSLKECARHYDDSGIEMSPTKKDERDECPEGEDFLEKARKVSSIDAVTQNGERNQSYTCSCSCSNEAACFARYKDLSGVSRFAEVTSVTLVNENRRRLSLSNPS